MLPGVSKLELIGEASISKVTERTYTSYKWDYDTGDFELKDGGLQVISGPDYIKAWCQKALKTVHGSLIYSNYGSEHFSVIGKVLDRDFVKEELKRLVTEALKRNEDIISVYDFEFAIDGDLVEISFTVSSKYGEVNISA